jgi:predicted adenine nucleotide alpha hydrolase (AANH) superfamily ATPase
MFAADKFGYIDDHEKWLEQVAAGFEGEPEKGARCQRCFRFNLAQTAKYAAEHGYDAFTSSLTVSPHKVSAMVFAAGNESAGPVAFLEIDFKKKNGFLLSLRRAKELGLYRQSYCGCEFSKLK